MLRRMARLSRNQLHLPSALRRLGDSIAEPFSFWASRYFQGIAAPVAPASCRRFFAQPTEKGTRIFDFG
jgi:hypothetical protein